MVGDRGLFFNPGGAFLGMTAKSPPRYFHPVLYATGYGPAGGPFINDGACVTMSADAVNLKATIGATVVTPSARVAVLGYVFSYDAYSGITGVDPEPCWNYDITLEPLDPDGPPPSGTVDYGGCYFHVTGYEDSGLILDTFHGADQQVAYHVPDVAPLAPAGETGGYMGRGAFGNVIAGNMEQVGGNEGGYQSQRLYAGRHGKVRIILECTPRGGGGGNARCGITVRASQVVGNSDTGLDSLDIYLTPAGANLNVYWLRSAAGAGVEGPTLLGAIPWAANQGRQLAVDFHLDDSGLDVYGADQGGGNPVLVGTVTPGAMNDNDAHRYVGLVSTHYTGSWDITRFQVLQPHLVAPAAVAMTMPEAGALADTVVVGLSTMPDSFLDTGVTIAGIAYTGWAHDWLAAALDGDTTPGELTLSVLPAASALLPGNYIATVSLVSDLGFGEPVDVVVTLTVTGMDPVPCEVRLELYEPDRETLAWDVSSNPLHRRPFLVEPEKYEEQQLDAAKCTATLGTVSVTVIDPAQIPGDQDSGWMTERLADAGGTAAVVGRRCRLRRYIEGIGWRTIADGPAGLPKLDTTYAAYTWEIRDWREVERKLTAFEDGSAGGVTVFPEGELSGYGYDAETDTYLVDPTTPAIGKVTGRDGLDVPGGNSLAVGFAGEVGLGGDYPVIFPASWQALQGETEALEPLAISDTSGDFTVGPFRYWALKYHGRVTFGGRLTVRWRPYPGGGAWHEVSGTLAIDQEMVTPTPLPVVLGTDPAPWAALAPSEAWLARYPEPPSLPGFSDANYTDLKDIMLQGMVANGPPNANEQDGTRVHWLVFGDLAETPDLPGVGDTIEILVLGQGPPTKAQPVVIEGITAGQYARNCYDGLYSPRDDAGAIVPSGILYDAAALARMTRPVRMRLTEPVDDVRDHLEKVIYQPPGWIPALDADGAISPVSQIPPTDWSGLPVVTAANAEPSADWDAGKSVYNLVRFTYQRDYRPADPKQAEASDGVSHRDIVVEYEDPDSIARNGEKPLDIDGSAFSAITADPSGGATTLEDELGWQLALERQAYIGARYALGAPAIALNLMQEEFPTLRAGDWVVVDLPWLPDYTTGRRGLVALAQVVSLGDLDCAWRSALLELSPTVLS